MQNFIIKFQRPCIYVVKFHKYLLPEGAHINRCLLKLYFLEYYHHARITSFTFNFVFMCLQPNKPITSGCKLQTGPQLMKLNCLEPLHVWAGTIYGKLIYQIFSFRCFFLIFLKLVCSFFPILWMLTSMPNLLYGVASTP